VKLFPHAHATHPSLGLFYITDHCADQAQEILGHLGHADGHTHDVAELVAELAERTSSHCVFGGLACSRGPLVH